MLFSCWPTTQLSGVKAVHLLTCTRLMMYTAVQYGFLLGASGLIGIKEISL